MFVLFPTALVLTDLLRNRKMLELSLPRGSVHFTQCERGWYEHMSHIPPLHKKKTTTCQSLLHWWLVCLFFDKLNIIYPKSRFRQPRVTSCVVRYISHPHATCSDFYFFFLFFFSLFFKDVFRVCGTTEKSKVVLFGRKNWKDKKVRLGFKTWLVWN